MWCPAHHNPSFCENVQGKRQEPFLRVEVEKLMEAGYCYIAWREVSSACFGVPNSKGHIILVATEKEDLSADSVLFSTVCLPIA